jgi:hypothetical protein
MGSHRVFSVSRCNGIKVLLNLLVACGCAGLLGAAQAARRIPAAPEDTGPSRASGDSLKASARSAGVAAQQARKIVRYGNLPLAFEPNQGQTDGRVSFLARGPGYALFLTRQEAVLELEPPAHQPATVVRMKLLGSNPYASSLSGLDELPGKVNYLIGKNAHEWRTNIPTYAKVTEQEVYPGVDLVYYGHQHQLEYDFIAAPKADVSRIQLEVEGAQKLHLDSSGNLLVEVPGGELTFQRPVAYQETDGSRQPVEAGYVIEGERQVAFRVGKYDSNASLVIDPILAYSTYLGGSNIDNASAIAVLSSDGTAFVAGGTFSSDFPTEHPLQPNAGGPSDFPTDAFVAKLSADGGTVLYATYLGGSREDLGNGIAVDSLGDAYVVGTTFSSDFPVTPGAFDPYCPPDGKCGASVNPNGLINSAGFLSELNPAGSALVYSTYFGGTGNTRGQAVAVDSNQNAYVTGSTQASDFPTNGSVCFSTSGPQNAILLKLDSTGSSDLFAAKFGGSVQDIGLGVAANGNGVATVAGITYSQDFSPITAGAFQSAYGGAGDAFITTIDTTQCGNGSFTYSTYLGGSGLDEGNGVAIDSTGKVYVTGMTKSSGTGAFPTTSGAYQTACKLDSQGNCNGDAFVAKLDPTQAGAASLLYSTLIGGSSGDSGNSIAVDPSDNAYITGSTNSTDFPVTTAVFQPTYGGGNADAFVTKLDPAGATLVYSSYLGGSNTDLGNGIAVDTTGAAYIAGQTCSTDFPLSNPAQLTPGGNCDAFISKVIVSPGIALSPAGLTFAPQLLNTTSQPQTITLDNGDAPLTITSITITGTDAGDFAQNNDCGTSQPPGGKCTITVTFTPTAAGTRTASVEIVDSAPGSPHMANLTGTGNPTGILSLNPTSLTFNSQAVGTTSTAQTIEATNTGNAPLTISSIVASGDYAETDNCTKAPLQPTTNCFIQVTFTPSTSTQSVGALTITDNAPGSPQVVLLTGNVTPQAAVALSATSLDFGVVAIGTSSSGKQVTLTNSGSQTLDISGIVASGDFSEGNTCSVTLPAGGSCAINIVFTPTTGGTRTGKVTITDNAADSPQVIALTGSGSDFSITASTPSMTEFAGTPAQFNVTITPESGFNAQVSLNCQLPSSLTATTCTVTPTSVTLDGTNPTQASVTIKTTARTMAPPGPAVDRPFSHNPEIPVFWVVAILATAILALLAARRRRVLLSFGLATLCVMMCVGCGSGRSFSGSGTPAGTYTVTINATSGSVVHSTTVQLTVN